MLKVQELLAFGLKYISAWPWDNNNDFLPLQLSFRLPTSKRASKKVMMLRFPGRQRAGKQFSESRFCSQGTLHQALHTIFSTLAPSFAHTNDVKLIKGQQHIPVDTLPNQDSEALTDNPEWLCRQFHAALMNDIKLALKSIKARESLFMAGMYNSILCRHRLVSIIS